MTQLKENEREEIKATCFLIGIKNRCRKRDRHYFNLGYIKLDELNDFKINELSDKAKQKFNIDFKLVEKATLNLKFVTLRKEEGCTIETFLMFDDREKNIQLI